MNEKKNNVVKGVLMILAALYIASPLDLLPGIPFDDIIVAVLTIMMNKKQNDKKEDNDYES